MLASKKLLAFLGLLALILAQVNAKCGPGNPCDELEEKAKQNGLLGGSLSLGQCEQKDLTTSSVETDSLSGRILSTLWIGADDKIVLAQTFPTMTARSSTVWRSANYGEKGSWNDMSIDFENALIQAQGRGANNSQFTGIVDMFISEPNPANVFFQGYGDYNWISRDFGNTVKAFKGPGGINIMGEYIANPVNSDYLMALTPRQTCWLGPDDSSCVKDLYVSFDFGETWGNVTHNSQKRIVGFWQAHWAASLVDDSATSNNNNNTPPLQKKKHGKKSKKPSYTDKTIYASVYENLKDVHGIDIWDSDYDKNIHFVRSDDWFGSKHEKIFSCGNIVQKIGSLVYLVAPASCALKDYKGRTQHGNRRSRELATDDDHAHLYVSEDYGQTFKEICLPVPLPAHHFAISEGDMGGSIVTAIHEIKKFGISEKVAYAYTSGNEVAMMTLSLKDIYCDEYTCELLKMEGIPGTFLANTVDMKAFDSATPTYNDVATQITFNGGATWSPLSAPAAGKYADPSCQRCLPGTRDCHLHLHIEGLWHTGKDAIPPLYSHANAPGVIMGVGNIGKTFDPNPASLCTFISRNGGHSWEQVLQGAQVYEIGDHGGIIVAAQHQSVGVTDEFYFSVNEGQCWQGPVKLDQPMNVDNIRVEANSASHIFSLQGTTCVHNNYTENSPTQRCTGRTMESPKGLVVNMDFMKLLQNFRTCGDSEYEEISFTPDQCQLGGQYTFSRRKLTSFCFNGKQYKHQCPFKKFCDCTQADYECEFGYVHNPKTKLCDPLPKRNQASCWLLDEGKYTTSITGLREIRADVCTRSHIIPNKGKTHHNDLIPYDTDGNGNSVKKVTTSAGMSGVASFFVFLIVAGLICAVGGFVWMKVLDDSMKTQITSVVNTAKEKVTAIIQGPKATSGFSDMRGGFEPLAEADIAEPMSSP